MVLLVSKKKEQSFRLVPVVVMVVPPVQCFRNLGKKLFLLENLTNRGLIKPENVK